MLLSPNLKNPPISYPEERPIDSFEGRWWVAHTKSRFEKTLAWDLIDRKISYFLPMIPRTHVRGVSKRKFLLPLFPSYVFFCGSGNQRIEALGTGRVCQVINVADQSMMLNELLQLQIALNSSEILDRCAIPRGQACSVTSGPLRGFKGVVLENHKVARLVLQISILGQGFSLEIDRDLLEPIEAGAPRTPVRIAG